MVRNVAMRSVWQWKYIAYCAGRASFQSMRMVLPLPLRAVTYAGSPHFSVSSSSPTPSVAAAVRKISARSASSLRRMRGGYAANARWTAALANGFTDQGSAGERLARRDEVRHVAGALPERLRAL